MIVCPQCAYPQEEADIIADSDVSCTFCGWKGTRKDLLRFMSNDLDSHPQIVDKLRVLMEYLHRRVSADVARKIVAIGLLPADANYAVLLATTMQKSTRAMYQSIVEELFVTGDQDADQSEPG